MLNFRKKHISNLLATTILCGFLGVSALSLPRSAQAGGLDPDSFTSIGILEAGAGQRLEFDTDSGRVALGHMVYDKIGSLKEQTNGPSIMVFTFDRITIPEGVEIQVSGQNAMALLSQSDATISQKRAADRLAD